jgi:DNA repair exonuclease SbcCD ATPase subunit
MNSNIEDCLALANLQPADLQELKNFLNLRANYYRAENSRMEATFLKLQLLDEDLQLFEECRGLIKKLDDIQQKLDIKELKPNAVALAYAQKLRKQNVYSKKLNIYLKMYLNLNEALTEKIKLLKCDYQQAQENVNRIVTSTDDELKTIKKKINVYEDELIKLEKYNSWLKNSDYDLLNISNEVNALVAARMQKEELVKELDCYCGLKPNLLEAREQLSQVKREYEEINKKLLDKY